MRQPILPVIALVVLALVIGFSQLALPIQAAATLYYVNPSGSDSNSCLTLSDPCATITGALNKGGAATISVANGVYKENLSISARVVISGSSPTQTIIDGSGNAALPVISVASPHFTLDDATVRNGGKGGLVVSGDATSVISVKNAIFDSNQGAAGGAITNHGTNMSLNRVSIQNNGASSGGGLYNDLGGVLVLNQVAVISSTTGVGIYNSGASLALVNVTVAQNAGGGITNVTTGTVGLYNATIASNPGGPGLVSSGAVVTLTNTLIASNGGPTASPDCSGGVSSGGYNLVQNAAGCTGLTATGDQVGVNAGIYALAKNSGFSMTMALAPTSPAVDKGNPTGCTDNTGAVLTQDQRNVRRPIGPACDIGAFELQIQSFLPAIFR